VAGRINRQIEHCVTGATTSVGRVLENRIDHELLAGVVGPKLEPDLVSASGNVATFDLPPLSVNLLIGDRAAHSQVKSVNHQAQVTASEKSYASCPVNLHSDPARICTRRNFKIKLREIKLRQCLTAIKDLIDPRIDLLVAHLAE
jgi:hypothetical protein